MLIQSILRAKSNSTVNYQMFQFRLIARQLSTIQFSLIKGDGGLVIPFCLVLLFPFTKRHILEVLESVTDFQ